MMDANGGQGQRFDGGSIARRLQARRGEMERAFARTCAVSRPAEVNAGEYGLGQRSAVAELIGYTIECISRGEDESTPVPSRTIAAVRKAARDGVALDAVLLRLIAAHTFINEFVLSEADDLPGHGLRRVQALQGSMLLRLAGLLSQEYGAELEHRTNTAQRRRAALVDRLLIGMPVDLREFRYPFDGWHLALVVNGPRALDAARLRAEALGGALLSVPHDDESVWAWIGSPHKVSVDRIRRALERGPVSRVTFAVGEPGQGVEGWRASHFEAQAAQAVAIRRPQTVTYFSMVALEAIALQAPDLARSLHAAYLQPLMRQGRGAETLRQTLRAYFAAGRNASSAASTLRVTRKTVENRLRAVESGLGRPLHVCAAELEMALRLEALREGDISSSN